MTQFQALTALYAEFFDTIIDENGEVLATQRDRQRGIALPLTGSRGVREKLRLRLMERNNGKTPREEALTQAIRWVEGQARDRGLTQQEVFVRTGQLAGSGTVWVDLGTPEPRYVRITQEGWSVVSEPEAGIAFRRPPQADCLPTPVPDDGSWSVEEYLLRFVNVEREDVELLVGALASGFVYRIPHPIMAFDGPHGSAKTFASKVVAGLLDPTAGHQRVPSSPQDLLAGARHHWVYALDNLTYIKDWQANDLCGLVTGYRSDSRRLYTNDELHSVSLRRVVLLSSIHFSGIARSDLVERTIFFPTPRIPENRRRAEEDLLEELQPLVPWILGRLFSLVSAGLRGLNRPEVQSAELPRMADFGRFLAALDAEVGGTRLVRYREKLKESVRDALRADTVGEALLVFVEFQGMTGQGDCSWTGTPSELYSQLAATRTDTLLFGGTRSSWPGSPSILMARLNGIDPSVRANGIHIERHRTGDRRNVTITWKAPVFSAV